MTCVEQVFGRGRGLKSAYQLISTPGWSPETLSQHVDDQPFVYARLFSQELVKINKTYQANFDDLRVEDIAVLASDWMIKLCTTAKQSIKEMCERFDYVEDYPKRHSISGTVSNKLSDRIYCLQDQFGRATEQLIEFAEAIDKVFKTVK